MGHGEGAVKRILVVDDDVAVQRHCREILEAEGFEVQCEASLGSTRRSLRTRPADIILLDLFLPDGCGFEVFKSSPELVEAIPILAMTSVYQGDANARILTHRHPFADLLAKPLSAAAVVGALQRLLGADYPGTGKALAAASAAPPAPARSTTALPSVSRTGAFATRPATNFGRSGIFSSPLDALARESQDAVDDWDPTDLPAAPAPAPAPEPEPAPAPLPTPEEPARPPLSRTGGSHLGRRAAWRTSARPETAESQDSDPSLDAPTPAAATPAPALAPAPAPEPPQDAADAGWRRRVVDRPAARPAPRPAPTPTPAPAPALEDELDEVDRALEALDAWAEADPESLTSDASLPAPLPAPEPSLDPEPDLDAVHTYVVNVAASSPKPAPQPPPDLFEAVDALAAAPLPAPQPPPAPAPAPAPAAAFILDHPVADPDAWGLVVPRHIDLRHVAVQGRLDATPVPAIFARLARDGVTGSLMLRRDQIKKIVYLQDGAPVAVKSNLLYECLGRMLVRDGVITEDVCERSVARLKAEGRPQGELLVEMGALHPDALAPALEAQFDAKLLDIFTWEAGLYQLRTAEEIDTGWSRVTREPFATALYATRARWPVERASMELMPFSHWTPLLLVPAEVLYAMYLTDPEWEILAWLDGQHTLGDLMAAAGSPELAWRLIYGLLSTGMLAFGERPR